MLSAVKSSSVNLVVDLPSSSKNESVSQKANPPIISSDSLKIGVKKDPNFKDSVTFQGMMAGATGGAIFGAGLGIGVTTIIGRSNNLTTMLAIPAIGLASGAIAGAISGGTAVQTRSSERVQLAVGTGIILGGISGAALSKGDIKTAALTALAGAVIGIGAGLGAQLVN